ncbi:hypothetical protein Pst134EA_032237 [Puccinia striiformis f. sp. tritici]|uniref:uncharacterized protein n=1 Tax=Puccinia striiformis f. sp. tritici TaxID=168172 RepID=UPI0020085DC7|nr:uncharacterized protein Pst134EA_032237 [Puccinia striiformis f. sp. tritici]KAH9444331.1 hypothetical protein Pst134EA_032237 [Puccinia striiformis f. sp. tritici]
MYYNGTAYPPPNLYNEGSQLPQMESINRAWLISPSTYHTPTNSSLLSTFAFLKTYTSHSLNTLKPSILQPSNSHLPRSQNSPAPIHEVFGAGPNSCRSVLTAPSDGYLPQPQVIQSPTSGELDKVKSVILSTYTSSLRSSPSTT